LLPQTQKCGPPENSLIFPFTKRKIEILPQREKNAPPLESYHENNPRPYIPTRGVPQWPKKGEKPGGKTPPPRGISPKLRNSPQNGEKRVWENFLPLREEIRKLRNGRE